MEKGEDRLYVSVDVGGTKIQASLFGESGAILGRKRCPTPRNCKPARAIAAIQDWKGRAVLPRDLTSGMLKVARSPEHIYLRIKVGVPGLMPPQGAALPPNEIWSIVRYLETSILPRRVAAR